MSMKIIIRIGKQQHNFLSHGEDVCRTVAELKQFCYCRFPRLKKEKDIRIYWHDQDGDDICVVTNGDYRSFLLATDKEKRRLYVEDREASQVYASVRPVQTVPDPATIATRPLVRNSAHATGPVHDDNFCNVCLQTIVGHRYRCLMCSDYDICMTCEAKYRHKEHIMLRIPRPIVGSRAQQNSVFENLEQHARNLKLSPEGADDDAVMTPNAKPTQKGKINEMVTGVRYKPTSHEEWPGKSQLPAVHQASAEESAIVHEQLGALSSDANGCSQREMWRPVRSRSKFISKRDSSNQIGSRRFLQVIPAKQRRNRMVGEKLQRGK